jgi:putative Mg2+ transporter-C (MgtC) family protein
MLLDLNVHIAGRLLLALVLGGAVGLERQFRHKPAGLRTNMLISFGSALFTIISYVAAGTFGGDHTRIAAQIIPGIGFIGAGVVIRERGAIMGITSAATIFVMASIGMACGAAMPVTAIFATLLLLVTLVVLGQIEVRFGLDSRLVAVHLTAPSSEAAESIRNIVSGAGIQPRRWQSSKTADGLLVEFDTELTVSQERELLAKLASLRVPYEVRALRP